MGLTFIATEENNEFLYDLGQWNNFVRVENLFCQLEL